MFKILIPFLVLLFNLFVIVYLENLNRKDSITKGYTFLLAIINGWFFFYIYNRCFYISEHDVFFIKIGAITWLAVGISFLNLINSFLKVKNGKVFYFFISLYIAVLILHFKTDHLIKSWGYDNRGIFDIKFGDYYPYIMIGVVLFPVIFGLIRIYSHIKDQNDKIQKFFLKRIFIVIIFVVSLASISDFFIPIFVDRSNIPETSVLSISFFCIVLNIMLLKGFSIHRLNILIGDFFENFTQPVLITDKRGNIIQYNREFDNFSVDMKDFFVKVFKKKDFDVIKHEIKYDDNYFSVQKSDFEITHEKKGIMYIFYDITLMKLKEKKLKNENLSLEEYEKLKSSEFYDLKTKIEENQKLYKILFENENLAIVIFDEENGDIFNCNNYFKNLFNVNVDLKNQNINKILKIDFMKKMTFITKNTLIKIMGKDYIVVCSCIEHHSRKKIVARFREYDINKKMEHYLIETERDNVLGVISSGLSHELNNVHTVLNGYFELLKRKYSHFSNEDENRIIIDDIEKMLKECVTLTESLNIFSGRSDDDPEMVDVLNLLKVMKNFIDNKMEILNLSGREIKLFCTKKKLSQLILSTIKYILLYLREENTIKIELAKDNGKIKIIFICSDVNILLKDDSIDIQVIALILEELRGSIKEKITDSGSEIILELTEAI